MTIKGISTCDECHAKLEAGTIKSMALSLGFDGEKYVCVDCGKTWPFDPANPLLLAVAP